MLLPIPTGKSVVFVPVVTGPGHPSLGAAMFMAFGSIGVFLWTIWLTSDVNFKRSVRTELLAGILICFVLPGVAMLAIWRLAS